jgi:hypothetical protein
MATKMISVLIDLEYPDSEVEASTSMSDEVESIINSGATENAFDVVRVLSSVYGADSIFELTEQ